VAQAVAGPLLVLGLPRSGTSATVAMFALDPSFRFFRAWEGNSPVPPPEAAREDEDPRVLAARAAAREPDPLAGVHMADADGPTEELPALAGMNFRAFWGNYPMPDEYIEWWIGEDFASTYAYHERALKLLQSRRPPNTWLLKAPTHLFHLDALAARYPGARFVMTHRDPCQTIPSTASLYWKLYERNVNRGQIDKAWAGERAVNHWAEGIRRGLRSRAEIGEGRFIDFYNRDLLRDPVGTFERAYDRLGRTVGAELAAALRRFQAENPPGKDGGHRYSAEEYGLTCARIQREFRDYIDRFGL